MSIDRDLKPLYRSSKFFVSEYWHPTQSFKITKFATIIMIMNTIVLEYENERDFLLIYWLSGIQFVVVVCIKGEKPVVCLADLADQSKLFAPSIFDHCQPSLFSSLAPDISRLHVICSVSLDLASGSGALQKNQIKYAPGLWHKYR